MDDFWRDNELREDLRNELRGVVFNEAMKEKVIQQVNQKPSFWKKEITIPVPAIAVVLVLLIAIPVIGWRQAASLQTKPLTAEQPYQADKQDRLIVSAAGVFYESRLEKEGEP